MTSHPNGSDVNRPDLGLGASLPYDWMGGTHGFTAWSALSDPAEVRRRLSPVRAFPPVPIVVPPRSSAPPPPKPKLPKAGPLRPCLPAWLGNTYRPRAVTLAGVRAMEALGPQGEGLRAFPLEMPSTLSERRDLLAAKYVALDLLRRGHVFEVCGSFYNAALWEHHDVLGGKSIQSFPESQARMAPLELLEWLAICRIATLDQILWIDPINGGNTAMLLLELLEKKLVATHAVRFGLGSIDVWALSDKGWAWVRTQAIEAEARGFGPLRSHRRGADPDTAADCVGHNAWHHLAQVDAILWFWARLKLRGAVVTGIWLDRALATEGGMKQGGHFLDFRMHWETAAGLMGSFDVEVFGQGHSYRGKAFQDRIRGCVAHRSFSASSARNVLGDHVVIGR